MFKSVNINRLLICLTEIVKFITYANNEYVEKNKVYFQKVLRK